MTEVELVAWRAVVEALKRCAVVLPVGEGVLTEVEDALELAEKAAPAEAERV